MSFSQIVVTGAWNTAGPASDIPAQGQVTFRLYAALTDQDDLQLPASDIVCRLTPAGTITVTLSATDDPTTRPVGIPYLVTEQLDGAYRQYYVTVPFDAPGGTVDLATLAPTEPPPYVPGGGSVTKSIVLAPTQSEGEWTDGVYAAPVGNLNIGDGTVLDGMSMDYTGLGGLYEIVVSASEVRTAHGGALVVDGTSGAADFTVNGVTVTVPFDATNDDVADLLRYLPGVNPNLTVGGDVTGFGIQPGAAYPPVISVANGTLAGGAGATWTPQDYAHTTALAVIGTFGFTPLALIELPAEGDDPAGQSLSRAFTSVLPAGPFTLSVKIGGLGGLGFVTLADTVHDGDDPEPGWAFRVTLTPVTT